MHLFFIHFNFVSHTLCRLRSRLESIEGDDELKAQIRTSIDKQTELLEAEQKVKFFKY